MAGPRWLPAGQSQPERGARLSLQGVSRCFTGRTVLDALDLQIASGEFLALLGPSGCGKSTLLRLIAGLDQPDAGTIERNDPETALAYVFQDASLMPWRSVLGNIALPLELGGTRRGEREARVAALLDTVGLTDAAHRFPGELSGGMRMRVSLARALVTRPALLLLDEPFAALDEFTRQYLDEHLQQLWLERGMTVVFVTHSISEAVFLADRVIVMSPAGGRLVRDFRVDLPRPRLAATRTGIDFTRKVQMLADTLREHSLHA